MEELKLLSRFFGLLLYPRWNPSISECTSDAAGARISCERFPQWFLICLFDIIITLYLQSFTV